MARQSFDHTCRRNNAKCQKRSKSISHVAVMASGRSRRCSITGLLYSLGSAKVLWQSVVDRLMRQAVAQVPGGGHVCSITNAGEP